MTTNAPLSPKQVRQLRGLAHKLDPLVQLGKHGMTPILLKEIDRCLADHELIKIRLATPDRAEFQAMTEQVARETGAAVVQTVGRVAVLYRPAAEPTIKLD